MHQNIKPQLVLNMNLGDLKQINEIAHANHMNTDSPHANSRRSLTIWQVSSSQPRRWIMTFFNDGASVDV